MKPESYLPKEAKVIFERILKHVKTNDLDMEIDSLELSMLAFSFWQYSEAMKQGVKEGFTQKFKNGTIQINGIYTLANNAHANILKHSPKFGLTPGDRVKIQAFAKKEVKEMLIDKLRRQGYRDHIKVNHPHQSNYGQKN